MSKKDESKGRDESASDKLLPPDFEKKARERFEKLSEPEITFEQYFKLEGAEFLRRQALETNAELKYKPVIGTKTPCGNGSFENGLDPAEWQGGYGSIPLSAVNPFANFTDGLFPGTGITDFNSHQTWVGTGTDPNVPIQTTAPGSAGAVRIGNAVNKKGCDLLSKTFVVTPALSTITFWYAVVLQNPLGHAQNDQPFFWVRVTDAFDNIVSGAFDFGNGPDKKLIADVDNPFFQQKMIGQETIVYKDWSCAQIDLSNQIGNQVTVEFVTADCGLGFHWGYAYIDSFCGDCQGSPTGNITYNCEASSHCGPGQICFDYSLPTAKDKDGNIITGSVEIVLYFYQNSATLDKISSGVLTSGNSYCFNITPASIPGLDPTLGGFDFTAVGYFAIGAKPVAHLGHIKVGTEPDGVTPGQNNDYQIACMSCEEIIKDQNAYLSKECAQKVNRLSRVDCDCPDRGVRDKGDCNCDCKDVRLPDLQPCISIAWGDSPCDCMETDDVEVLCVTVCNCYSNVTFNDLSIGRIKITDMAGNPVPILPDGTPSVQVIPSGPICFGDIGPCQDKNQPDCVSRELVLYTRGAIGKNYRLSLEGVCFSVTHHFQSEQCFVVDLCQD
jgi:hypothetical protein